MAQDALGQTIGKPTALSPGANTDTKLLIYGLFQKGRVLAQDGFRDIARFLRRQCFYHRRDLPYRTQLVPLAAVLTRLSDRWLAPQIYDKLTRWFRSGVLGELYGGAVETRMANDYGDMLGWFGGMGTNQKVLTEAYCSTTRSYS